MTKYMKITRTNSEELYIDLYKINRIQESHHSVSMNIPCHWDVADQVLEKYFNDMGCFSTSFSVPGERDMKVFGTAKEFISHIEEQQKRARKGKEVQPYEPIAGTVYKKNGSVHPINNLLEPTDATNRCRRELNSQASDYIQKIIDIGTHGHDYYDYHAKYGCREDIDHQAVTDLWDDATRQADEGNLSIENYQLIHSAVRPIVAKAMKYNNESR